MTFFQTVGMKMMTLSKAFSSRYFAAVMAVELRMMVAAAADFFLISLPLVSATHFHELIFPFPWTKAKVTVEDVQLCY